MGATKLTGRVAEVGWKFTEVASQKVSEVSGVVTDKVTIEHFRLYPCMYCMLRICTL